MLSAFREYAQDNHLTILLASHSPFLLNEFREEPEKAYIMDQNEKEQLTRLDQLRDPEWLKYFILGNLYGTEFGKQA